MSMVVKVQRDWPWAEFSIYPRTWVGTYGQYLCVPRISDRRAWSNEGAQKWVRV